MIRHLLLRQKNKEKIAIIEHEKEILYCDLIQKALVLRESLPKDQTGPIALFLPDSADYVAAFWGVISLGMIVLPLNVSLTRCEAASLFKQVSVNTIVTLKVFCKFFEELAAGEMLSLKIIYIDELDDSYWEKNIDASDVGAEETMVLLNTSGTTGKFKVVELSEKNIESSVNGQLKKMNLDESESDDIRVILAVPFSSIYGIMILAACLKLALPIVLPDHNFTLNSLYRTVAKHKVTHYEGSASVIMMMEQMAGRPISHDIGLFRYIGFGGSKVSGHSIEKVMKAYPEIEFSQGYGMTEAAPLIAKRPRGIEGKEESVGTAIDGLDIAVETERGITRSPGAIGEIIVNGPNVMRGYYNNEDETARVIKNGYLYTGDIGYLDEDGFLYICGRKKNVIIVRGFNVYPEEVEGCILNSLLVKDCFVYGQIDDFGNECVCADIVPIHPQVQAAGIKKYCRTHLAEYKQPQRIMICESIKKNLTGKTERSKGLPS